MGVNLDNYKLLFSIGLILLISSMLVYSAPTITHVISGETTTSSAHIHWDVSPTSNATVEYSNVSSNMTDDLYYSYDAGTNTVWNVILTDLNNNTQYWYNITSCQAVGGCDSSAVYSFYTEVDYSGILDEDANFWSLALVIFMLGLCCALLFIAKIIDVEHAILKTFLIMLSLFILLVLTQITHLIIQTSANIGLADSERLTSLLDNIYLALTVVIIFFILYFMLMFVIKMVSYAQGVKKDK